MISETMADRILAPLWIQFPTSEQEAYRRAVTNVVARVSDDDDHAFRLVEQLCHTSRYRPPITYIHEAAAATRRPQSRCSQCDDTGWIATARGAVRCPECQPQAMTAGGGR